MGVGLEQLLEECDEAATSRCGRNIEKSDQPPGSPLRMMLGGWNMETQLERVLPHVWGEFGKRNVGRPIRGDGDCILGTHENWVPEVRVWIGGRGMFCAGGRVFRDLRIPRVFLGIEVFCSLGILLSRGQRFPRIESSRRGRGRGTKIVRGPNVAGADEGPTQRSGGPQRKVLQPDSRHTHLYPPLGPTSRNLPGSLSRNDKRNKPAGLMANGGRHHNPGLPCPPRTIRIRLGGLGGDRRMGEIESCRPTIHMCV